MSQIDLIAHTTPSISLFNAICKRFAAGEIRDVLKLGEEGSAGEVKLTFNGVEIPFDATIEDMWRQVNDDVNQRALKMAKEMVAGAGLNKVREAFEQAEWELSNALEQALSRINSEVNAGR